MDSKKNIAIINGHPDPISYCAALAEAYRKGADNSQANVRCINIHSLHFEPNLKYGFRKRLEMEEDLIRAQETIKWADHLVFVYPVWWGVFPAILKGFIDRVFLPGFAFKYRSQSKLWNKLLRGKTARLIVTMDTPSWYYRMVNARAGHLVMKRGILQFCGVNPVKITQLSDIRSSSLKKRERWLADVAKLGAKGI